MKKTPRPNIAETARSRAVSPGLASATDHYGNTLRVGDYAQALYDDWNRTISEGERTPYRIAYLDEHKWPNNPTGATLIGRSRRCERVEVSHAQSSSAEPVVR